MTKKPTFRFLYGATLISAALVFGACSSGSASTSIALSPEAKAGQELASASGCASCHGSDGEGRVGVRWIGLADSQVTLSDGTVVTADDAYLYTSIKDPNAMRRKGVTSQMPSNNLTDDEIASIIVYIRALKG